GMWEFPAVEKGLTLPEAEQQLSQWGGAESVAPGVDYKHVFTHLVWQMNSYRAQMQTKDTRFFWVTKEELSEKIPLPGAMQPFFRALSGKVDTKN
ncbi:MAG: NUDIX domain-containing protein, partial [Clostridia bacterium]|nr:NUDIX domain-containing protein [Clostridia bacterium]